MADTLITSDVLRRLEQLSMVSRKLGVSRLRGERKGRQRGSSNEFTDYRNYVVGDDLRHLDWKVYARLERLFIKLFLEEQDLQVSLLLDVSESMTFGTPAKLLWAKQVAAALGYVSLCQLDRLRVLTFGGGLEGSFGPKRGKVNASRYFDFLQRAPTTTQTDLTRSLRSFANSTTGRGLVIVISDFYDFNGFEEGLRILFGRNFEVVVLQVLSPEELKPTLTGDLRLVDSEYGQPTDVSVGRTLLHQYAKTLGAFTDSIRTFVTNHGGHYLLASSDLPFDRLVLDVMCRQGMLK